MSKAKNLSNRDHLQCGVIIVMVLLVLRTERRKFRLINWHISPSSRRHLSYFVTDVISDRYFLADLSFRRRTRNSTIAVACNRSDGRCQSIGDWLGDHLDLPFILRSITGRDKSRTFIGDSPRIRNPGSPKRFWTRRG